jgi:tetratricopeptide (TPR) repeat protein
VADKDPNHEALAYSESRLRDCPDDGVFWILKANCHYRLGELAPAAEAYGRAVELGEVRSHANFFRGLCLIELGELKQAAIALEAQLELTPDHPEALFLLGLILKQQGERARGDQLLSRMEAISPGLYGEMYAEYAGALAADTEDPLLRKGLQEAVAELRRRSQEGRA